MTKGYMPVNTVLVNSHTMKNPGKTGPWFNLTLTTDV